MHNPEYLRKLDEVSTLTGIPANKVVRISSRELRGAEDTYGKVIAEKLYTVVWEAPKAMHYEWYPSTPTLALALMLKNHPKVPTGLVSYQFSPVMCYGFKANPSMEWMVRNYPEISELMRRVSKPFGEIGGYEMTELITAFYDRSEDFSLTRVDRVRELIRKIIRSTHDPAIGLTIPQLLDIADCGDEWGDDIAVSALVRWAPVETRGYALNAIAVMHDEGIPVKAAFEILSASKDEVVEDIPRIIAEWKEATDSGMPMELVESLFGVPEGKLANLSESA